MISLKYITPLYGKSHMTTYKHSFAVGSKNQEPKAKSRPIVIGGSCSRKHTTKVG